MELEIFVANKLYFYKVRRSRIIDSYLCVYRIVQTKMICVFQRTTNHKSILCDRINRQRARNRCPARDLCFGGKHLHIATIYSLCCAATGVCACVSVYICLVIAHQALKSRAISARPARLMIMMIWR